MRNLKLSVFIIGFLCLLISVPEVAHNEIAGEAGRPKYYRGRVELGNDSRDHCDFSIEIERVTFLLNAFGNKYKVIRIRAENYSNNSVQLSLENDSIELIKKEDDKVQGLFKLQNQDATLWDSLDQEMRDILAYPQTIQAGVAGRPKIIYLFAFFPKDRVTKLPISFLYKIASLPKPIEIAPPPVAAK